MTGAEDTAIPLTISSDLTDVDGSETLSLTISGVPEGATLSAGSYDEDTGDWTLTPDQLDGLTVTPAANDSDNFQLTVAATTTDGTDTATVSETLDVTVQGVADAPTLDVSDAAGTEDTAIPLDIQSGLTDDSEVLSVTISGVPEGATLSAGTYDEETGDWTLTPADLEGLTVTPAPNSDDDFNLTVTATSTETDPDTGEQGTATTTGTIAVSVDPEADAPTLVVDDATGNEDTAIPLNVSAELTDAGETLGLSISGIPDGAVLTVTNPAGEPVEVSVVDGVARCRLVDGAASILVGQQGDDAPAEAQGRLQH